MKIDACYVTLTDENFDREVLEYSSPVLVKFAAEWSGPCQILSPVLEELGDVFQGRLKIGRVDVDENEGLVETYGIRDLPTVLFFLDGEIVDHIIGAVAKNEFKAKLKFLLEGTSSGNP
jgi:thioredoxin 1